MIDGKGDTHLIFFAFEGTTIDIFKQPGVINFNIYKFPP